MRGHKNNKPDMDDESKIDEVVHKNSERANSPQHDDKQPAPEEVDEEIEAEAPAEEEERPALPENAMAAGYSLDGLLAEAAASASLLIVEAERTDSFGFAQEGEEGGGWNLTTLLVTGAVVITGVVIWATSGGGNKPPTVDSASQSVSTNEDTSAQITVNATDKDELTYAVTTAPTNGSANVSGNVVTYSPTENFNGSDNLTVTVTDTKGQTVTQAVAITVVAVNDAPRFEIFVSTKAIFQGQSLSEDLDGQATDVDGDTLTFATETSPGNGTLSVDPGGMFVYTPSLEFVGVDTFSIEVNDNKGGSDVRSYVVTVRPVPIPEPPTGVSPQEIALEEDTLQNVVSTIVDANNDPITFTIPVLPQNGTLITVDEGVYVYQPNPNFNGTDTFSLRGTTPDGESFTEQWSVTVTPVNDAPTAPETQNLTTAEATPLVIPLVASDVDQADNVPPEQKDRISPTVLADDMPENGVLSVEGDTLTYTPDEGFTGEDKFKVTYTDRAGASVKTTVTVTVTEGTGEPINHAPTGTSPLEVVTDEDVGLNGTSDITDQDMDTIEFALHTPAANGAVTVDQTTGAYTYQPDVDFNGSDDFTIRGTSQDGEFLQVVSVTVRSVNDDPVVGVDATLEITTPVNTPANFIINGFDPDGDAILVSSTLPEHGTIGDADDDDPTTFVFDPTPDFAGDDEFRVTFDDGNGGIVSYDIPVKVTSAQEVSINGTLPSEPNDFFDAGTGDWTFNVDGTLPVHIVIEDLKTGDIIRISNASMDDFFLRPTGGNTADVFLESMTDPLQHRIFLPDIFPSGPPDSYAFADAFESAGFDFVAFQTVP